MALFLQHYKLMGHACLILYRVLFKHMGSLLLNEDSTVLGEIITQSVFLIIYKESQFNFQVRHVYRKMSGIPLHIWYEQTLGQHLQYIGILIRCGNQTCQVTFGAELAAENPNNLKKDGFMERSSDSGFWRSGWACTVIYP